MESHELNEMQTNILMALLEKRARLEQAINEQVAELAGMIKRSADVPEDWVLTGNPQTGFVLRPPEEANDQPTA